MRPRVLDRIETGSLGSSIAGRKKRAEGQMQRGPKDRPVYRIWEHATWRVRMRAWCNTIKNVLLSDDHDPGRPQTYKTIKSERCPIQNASTWLTWWTGDAIPRPSHVRAAEQLAPGSSRLLDLSEMGTAIQRHFVALDVLNTRFRITGRPSDFQRSRSQLLLTTLNNAWGPFLDPRPVGSASRFALEAQLGSESADLLYPVALGAEELEWVRLGGNLRRFALPRRARLEHNWLEPRSIFRFLGLLATFRELDNPALLQMWAYDFASAAIVVRIQLELAGTKAEMPVLRMGNAGVMYALAVNTFWAPARLTGGLKAFDLIRLLASGEDAPCFRDRLHAARLAYYAGFAALGIPEKAVRALNANYRKKTWDESFSAPRARL